MEICPRHGYFEIIMPGQEANGDRLEMPFHSSEDLPTLWCKIMICCVYLLESPR